MIIIASDEKFRVGRAEFIIGEIKALLDKRDAHPKYPAALKCEKDAKNLIKDNFPGFETKAFIESVCAWGGGERFIGRVEAKRDLDLSNVLREAYDLCQQNLVGKAVAHISDRVRYLGFSFASKQLRFLAPEKAVILDSVIRHRLGYAPTIAGYDEFLQDCASILELARSSGKLDQTLRQKLRICDVEVALYISLGKNKERTILVRQ